MQPISRILVWTFFCLLFDLQAHAQRHNLKDELLAITHKSDSLNQLMPAEKLFIQTDKPYYAIGDTLWFKAYLLSANYFIPTQKSGLVYIDVADNSNRVIKQMRFKVIDGLSWGNIGLNANEFKPGRYTLRAYTNWMRNFDNESFLYKLFEIIDSTGRAPKVQRVIRLKNRAVKQSAMTAPITRQDNIDLQFMPEGGSLIAGLASRVGFKAIGLDGLYRNFTGIILNQSGKQVTTIKTLHNGMGSFDIIPNKNETYTARIMLADGNITDCPLPVAKPYGTMLQVADIGTDSLRVSAFFSSDRVMETLNYYLIGKARGIVCYAAVVNFSNSNSIKKVLPKSLFPTGIAHFTLFNLSMQPVNERMVFIDHRDRLCIDLLAEKPVYAPRDSVTLHLNVSDSNGQPVAGNFSIAVTDDAQVKTDDLNYENISARMLLGADLRGNIEQPGYYFDNPSPQSRIALDNLMLTQGWIGYNWQQLSSPLQIKFAAEPYFSISGTVKNVLNKPITNATVLSLSRKPSMMLTTFTGNDGRFRFNNIPLTDTAIFNLQASSKDGITFNKFLTVEAVEPPAFLSPIVSKNTALDFLPDITTVNYAKITARHLRLKDSLPNAVRTLKEVKIVAKKIIKGSANINGPGNADVVIDEKELEKAGKKSLLDVLNEKVKGFCEKFMYTPLPQSFAWPDAVKAFDNRIKGTTLSTPWYFINGKVIVLFVDGIAVQDMVKPFGFVKCRDYLRSCLAENIKGIEISSSTRYNSSYLQQWGYDMPDSELTYRDFAFIEITTRSGSGPNMGNTPNVYLYKPLALTYPNQFYKPRYTIKKSATDLPDLRSTIHWQPNVITGKDGRATIGFFSADARSTYHIILEGTDLNGNLGSVVSNIKVP